MAWLSISKIATSVAFMRLWEREALHLDDPVCRHVPEFAANGKQHVTLRHLLTHTCGLLSLEQTLFAVRYRNSFAENVAAICAAEPDAGRVSGRSAGYQTTAAMLLLAEVIRRLDGRDFDRFVREEVFEPRGMRDCWIGMPRDRLDAYAERVGQTFDTSRPEPVLPSFAPDAPEQITHVMPGGNGRGPMRELARLLELLRLSGELDGVRLLRPPTVEAMTARQRTGLFDESWQTVLDWGLGLILDSKLHHGGRNHLYGYGRYASPRTFGHSGFRTSVAFCDPECDLVVACVWNGMVADDVVHSRRQNRLCEAVYRDLGLVSST
jgi:CubicO group peptidase (beta-lactamase class C family)